MKQKVVITKSEKDINEWIELGWRIVSVTAQEIAGGTSAAYGFQTGEFCFVLEKVSR